MKISVIRFPSTTIPCDVVNPNGANYPKFSVLLINSETVGFWLALPACLCILKNFSNGSWLMQELKKYVLENPATVWLQFFVA